MATPTIEQLSEQIQQLQNAINQVPNSGNLNKTQQTQLAAQAMTVAEALQAWADEVTTEQS